MLFRNHQILFLEEQYGKSGKEISICCWDLQTNTLRREYTAAFDQSESVALRSFRRSRTEDLVAFVVENRDSLPAVFVCLNRTTGEVTRVDLTFLPEAPEYAFQERVVYDWNDSGDRLIFGFGSQAYLADKDGNLLYSISTEDTIATTMFSPDGKYVYLLGEEGRILKCDVSDGRCTDEICLRDYCTADGILRGNLILSVDRLQWTFIGESELLIYDWSNGGFLLEISGEEIRMKAVLPKCCGYDPELDQFLVSDSYYLWGELSSLGVFHRYSQEDLIQKAQKILQP
jgi:hypothetical protein